MVLWLYLIHLLLPAFILVDLAWAWYGGTFSGAGTVGLTVTMAAVGSAVWLAVGLGALVFKDRRVLLRQVAGVLLSFYTTLIMLMIGEVAARYLYSRAQSRRTFLRKPGSDLVNVADAGITPGTSGRKHFTVNEKGLRGPSFSNAPDVYRIIAAGGSTTECWYLDDSEEWPHLLMNELNGKQQQLRVWTANAGFSGHTTVHTRLLLQSVSVLKDADMLILMVGINDLQATIERDGAATDAALESAATRFLDGVSPKHCNSPNHHTPFVLRSRLYKQAAALVRSVVFKPSKQEIDELEADHWYGPVRRQRAGAKTLPLPDLKVGLAEYGERIVRLSEECRKHSLRCLFLTQPTIWRADLTADERRLTWFGWVGPRDCAKGYVPVEKLAPAMARYNLALIETCKRNGLECYDLAAVVPKDTSALFDDCHFNEEGARMVARSLGSYLLGQAPFRRQSQETGATP